MENEEKIIREGTHGTTASRASKIKENGFSCSGGGRVGKGAYFWRSGTFAERLAVSWYRKMSEEGHYWQDVDPACVVICAKFELKKSEFLDLELYENKQKLAALTERMNWRKPNEAAKLYDALINAVQSGAGVKIRVLEVRVTTAGPQYCNYYPIEVVGLPLCLVAKDKDIVSITDYKSVKVG